MKYFLNYEINGEKKRVQIPNRHILMCQAGIIFIDADGVLCDEFNAASAILPSGQIVTIEKDG